jgi:NAD(P)-dependent dehydrogenase (short-subunit alcohol dehydrogenase family)
MTGMCEGRVAVVTGAGRGIGREYALMLAEQGAKVIVNDLGGARDGTGADTTPAQQVVEEIEAMGGEAAVNGADVSDFAAAKGMIDQAIDTFGGLDIVVNNAGILRDRMLTNMAEEEWDLVLRIHLKGTFAPARHAAAYWRERTKAGETNDARIINTTSVSGIYGNVGQTNYGAAKAGIAGFTIIAAQELARYGVTVNCLAPNARTRMTEASFGEIPKPEEGFDAMDPANIAPIVVALCADEAQDITGQCFFIYGGAVNVLRPWDAGELFARDDKWDADELLAQLRERFPGGTAPEGMVAQMGKAGGRSLQVG